MAVLLFLFFILSVAPKSQLVMGTASFGNPLLSLEPGPLPPLRLSLRRWTSPAGPRSALRWLFGAPPWIPLRIRLSGAGRQG